MINAAPRRQQPEKIADEFANNGPDKSAQSPAWWAFCLHSTTLYFAHLIETSIKKGEKS
jgi:hypothetical protein